MESGINKVNVQLKTYLATNVKKYAILPINVDHPTGHKVSVKRHRGSYTGNQLQHSDHKKSPKAALSRSEPIYLTLQS